MKNYLASSSLVVKDNRRSIFRIAHPYGLKLYGFRVCGRPLLNLLSVAMLLGAAFSQRTPAFASSLGGPSGTVSAAPDVLVEVPESAEEIPEEILRTEIITEARSPLTGEVMSAADYAQLQAELADSAGTPLVSEDLRYLIFLLEFRRAVKPIIPFL